MKFKVLICVCLFTFLIFIMQGCNPAAVVGIGKPITIDGIDLSVTSVTRKSEFSAGGQVSRPSSSSDIILIVKADVSAGNEEVKEKGWKFSVVDENGRIDTPSITSFMSGTINGEENKNVLELVFAVDKNSDSFTLMLPENEIVLDSLLAKSK